jgi:hypothetical protein
MPGSYHDWTFEQLIRELRSFYMAQFGIELSDDLSFVSEENAATGALVRTHTAVERVILRPERFLDIASFEHTFAALQSSSIFSVTFVLVLTSRARSYFIYEVSRRAWHGSGIANILMTHALPDSDYELIVER